MYTPVAIFRVSYYKQHLSHFSFQDLCFLLSSDNSELFSLNYEGYLLQFLELRDILLQHRSLSDYLQSWKGAY